MDDGGAVAQRHKHRLGDTVDTRYCKLWDGATGRGGYGVWWQDGRTRLVHRCIWEKLNGPIPEKHCILHACDNPKCVNPDHLFLGTYQDNAIDARIKGRLNPRRGSKHPRSKLTPEAVRLMRQMYEQDNMTFASIGELFGVHRTCVHKVCRYLAWKHVTS
jgi:hypothetical protein